MRRCEAARERGIDSGAASRQLEACQCSGVPCLGTPSRACWPYPVTQRGGGFVWGLQAEMFETVAAPLVACVLRGNSAAVVAYGQTGSGKTHTMEGADGSAEHKGLIPRLVSSVAAAIEPPGEGHDPDGARFTLSLTVVEVRD
jgi:hypothetical protein